MNAAESIAAQNELIKARTLNRAIARTVDLIIVWALLQIIPTLGYFLGLAYLLIADGLFEGRSVGKRLMGLKVILNEKDETCSFKHSVIRNFIFAIAYVLWRIPLIGFVFPVLILFFEGMLIIGSDRGMRFGDEIANTQVVEEEMSRKEGGPGG